METEVNKRIKEINNKTQYMIQSALAIPGFAVRGFAYSHEIYAEFFMK